MIRLRALGPAQLVGSGDEKILSVLAQPKRLALLVYLAAADPIGFHRRDELVALFWPERDSPRARAALRKSLHHLRRSLGHDAIPGRGDEVGLDPDVVWSDVRAFRTAAKAGRAEEALDHYRGDLLEGLHSSGSPAFERWLDETRRALRRTACSVALEAAEASAEGGDSSRAGDLARRAAGLCPFDETVHRRVLRILGEVGDHTGALHFHELFVDRMAEELDVAPGPETLATVETIRSRLGSVEPEERAGLEAEGPVPGIGTLGAPEPTGRRAPDPGGAVSEDDLPPDPPEAAARRRSPRGDPIVIRAGIPVAVLALVGLLGWGAWTSWSSARQTWAFEEALPEIQRLVDDRRMVAAQLLALEAEPYLDGNVEFRRLKEQTFSPIPLTVKTDPPGARVSVTDYATPDGVQFEVGTAPLERARVPGGALRLRVEHDGFHPFERQFRAVGMGLDVVELNVELQARGGAPEMVRIPVASATEWRPVRPPEQLGAFWLDHHEVTNQDFAEFVAQGGYQDPHLWKELRGRDGSSGPGEATMARFVDRTGRPGPATWELGSYLPGTEEHPVGGVSWYEAAAFCRAHGKRLPTVHHWYKAAGLGGTSGLLSFSNMNADGPGPVDSTRSVSSYGVVDMPGNVREWVLNPVEGDRYILGGAWSDAGYMFYLPDAAPPLDRSAQNGFRCARFPEDQLRALSSEVVASSREFPVEPVDDARFERARAQFSYPAQPLNASVESVDDALPYWRREVVSFDAPYGSERIQAHLFLPKSVEPPFRAVVFYPGATPFRLPSVDLMETTWFDFLVRTGFAVIHPIYEGHFGREASGLIRERLTHWTMDIRRSIDYLETREDVAADKVAFYGHSYGAWNGPIFTAMEPRFKASVLFGGGAVERQWPAELQPLNHAPRARMPVLMVNGRDDFFYPEPLQRRLFDLLGAPEEDKRYVPLEGGHFPGDWPTVMTEIIDWLERYLGPAEPGRNSSGISG